MIVILIRSVLLDLVIEVHGIPKVVLWCLGVVFLVSGVSAFTVTAVSISPSGTLNPGDLVNVSYTVYAASGVAFPSYDDLQFISGLDNMAWSYSLVVNGVENVRPVVGGRTLTIPGFELSYRNQDEVLVKVSLRGRIPLSSVPGSMKTLVTIQELDSRGYAINSSIVTVDRLVGLPTPTPTPAFGRISVTSDPAGANVYLDNAYKGIAPLTLESVPNGNHVIVLRLDRYEESSRGVLVNGNSPSVFVTLALLPTLTPTVTSTVTPTGSGTIEPTTAPVEESGSLSVTTSPPGARVYVDGELKGVTPATIPGLSAGKHTVLLSLAGYLDLNTTITINAGKTSEYSTALTEPAKTPGFGVIAAVLSFGGLMAFRKIRK
ncbi:MAG TPA: PEGA domain-containing protein [Methanoregula sp.]|nr:PEGA domain-containing protein [Methanoregula sp.]